MACRFNVEVREGSEVLAIDRQARQVTARDVATGEESTHPYDALVLAPGAAAIQPPLPGIKLPGIFQMKAGRWGGVGEAEVCACVCGGGVNIRIYHQL